ncbi:MAG: hypothetical protein HYT77_01185 [Deltaproteobacteria bacterium]|nr:hypothetical protein [Deltaproteobacteria bacterium]
MIKKRVIFLLLFSWPILASGSPCWKSIFETNERPVSKNHKLLILPFENGSKISQDDWISHLFPVLLQDFLSLAKKTHTFISVADPSPRFFDSSTALEIAKKAGADYVITGKFSRTGQAINISTRFLDVREGIEKRRLTGNVEFPGTRTINDYLALAVEAANDSFPDVHVKKKELLTIRHETLSNEALRYFVLGSIALRRGSLEGVREAVRRFEESIRNDYNFVPAYLGLALSLVRQGFVENMQGENFRPSFTRARLELEKARLMKPALTKKKAEEIEPYLKAETDYQLSEGYLAQGDLKGATREMRKVTEFLPGDLGSHERAFELLTKQGRIREAEYHQRFIENLNSCAGEKR